MRAPRARAVQSAPPKRVTLREFAQRRRCDRKTILDNPEIMRAASKDGGHGWTWPVEFVDAACASLPAPVDRNQYPHTKADVARLVGATTRSLERWGGGILDPTGQRQRFYSDADLCSFIVKVGKIGLEAVCYFLEACNPNPVVLLIDRGHLQKPDTVDRQTGEWLWTDPAKMLARCHYLLSWINQGNAGSLRADLADCCQWDSVSGMEDLEQWALEETDRAQAAWRERSRSPAAKAERERIEAERQAEEHRQWLADAPKREAERQAEKQRKKAERERQGLGNVKRLATMWARGEYDRPGITESDLHKLIADKSGLPVEQIAAEWQAVVATVTT